MALFFVLAGLILLVTGVNGTVAQAGVLIKRDFTGPGNFITWALAIIIVGSLGYAPKLRPFSYALLALVFVTILLTSGSGVFDRLQSAIGTFAKVGAGSDTSSSGNDGLFSIEYGLDKLGDFADIVF